MSSIWDKCETLVARIFLMLPVSMADGIFDSQKGVFGIFDSQKGVFNILVVLRCIAYVFEPKISDFDELMLLGCYS